MRSSQSFETLIIIHRRLTKNENSSRIRTARIHQNPMMYRRGSQNNVTIKTRRALQKNNFNYKTFNKPIVEPVRYTNNNFRNPNDTQRNWQSYRGQQINNPRKTRSGYVQIAETQTNGPKYKDAKVYQTISNRDNASKIRNSEPAGKNPVTRYGSSRDVRKNAAMLTETVKPPIKATPYKENARENNLQREKQTAHHKRPLNGKTEDELTDWNEIVELDSNMINKTVYINSNMKDKHTLQYSDVLKSGNSCNINNVNNNSRQLKPHRQSQYRQDLREDNIRNINAIQSNLTFSNNNNENKNKQELVILKEKLNILKNQLIQDDKVNSKIEEKSDRELNDSPIQKKTKYDFSENRKVKINSNLQTKDVINFSNKIIRNKAIRYDWQQDLNRFEIRKSQERRGEVLPVNPTSQKWRGEVQYPEIQHPLAVTNPDPSQNLKQAIDKVLKIVIEPIKLSSQQKEPEFTNKKDNEKLESLIHKVKTNYNIDRYINNINSLKKLTKLKAQEKSNKVKFMNSLRLKKKIHCNNTIKRLIKEINSNKHLKAKRVQKYKTRNNKSNTEKSIPEKEPMTKAPYYIETMSRRISTESAIEHKNKKEDNTKESQHAKKGQVTTSANIGSRRANIEPCTPRDTSINMTFNESNQCKTVAELINEENKLLDIIQNRAKKRKLIDARTRRINILKQFIQEMSPDNSGDEEQLKQHEEAEKKMMETINFYNKQKDKHRGAAFTQVFADKNQDNIIKLATTLSIEDIKPQSNSSNEQIYRVTYDITQNYTYQYVQTINKEDITNLYHNSTQDASFLRPVKNTTTTTMETEVIQQESSKRDETSSTISESPQTPMQAITTPIKHLQENINKPSTSRYKEIYTTSESNDINKDENYNPTPKRNIKTTTRKRGRPRKVKQPNQYTKTKAALKETIPERQKPTIISDIVLTKNFNELVSAHRQRSSQFAGEECATATHLQ
ncbi:hypothetical protein ALC60_08979 [Trachymyrmex zeteki]|uniref:Uncharacterized protein n=1 Tax=Mycetomoellerius zeteki TaxID=64791 RepID=A0A151WVW9_9HYME|nr:hypothetical protein ALC60_08979 [Trachymyrmex zeteki]